METLRLTKPTNMSPQQCGDAEWMKFVRCPQVYNEYILKGAFVEDFPS